MGAARTQERSSAGTAAATGTDARVAALLSRHGGALMRVARAASLCQDDAFDAVQRALEIYLRRIDTVDRATEGAWMKVVVRHEAYAIRRARGDCIADPELDLDAILPTADRSVEEQVESGDRVSRSAEALRALKPDEARALMLKAHGLSYEEIGRHCGWTYTKVNRCITEGRRRFMEVYAALESGDACERFAEPLRALAAGTATSTQLVELRPHLRACPSCRATVRDLHLSGLRRVTLLAPIPGLGWVLERLHGHAAPPHIAPQLPGPDGLVVPHIPGTPDAVPVPHDPGLTDPAGSSIPHAHGVTDLAGNPIPGLDHLPERVSLVARAKQHLAELFHRTAGADLTTGIQIAATTGGGRVATLGAIVGLCLSGVGAGTVCVVTGVLHPFGLLGHHATKVAPRVTTRHAESPPRLSAEVATFHARQPRATPTPAPHPVAKHIRHATPSRPTASQDPAQGTTPTSQEHAPISPAAPATTQEFSAAPAAGTGTQAPPAAAPATGGGEFGP